MNENKTENRLINRITEEKLLYNFYFNVTHWAAVSVRADSEANCSSKAPHIRVFRPKPHSGRSANLVLNDRRKKKFPSVRFEPLALAQVSETILTELTHHLLRDWKFKILIVMLYWIPLNHALLNSAKSTKINKVTKVVKRTKVNLKMSQSTPAKFAQSVKSLTPVQEPRVRISLKETFCFFYHLIQGWLICQNEV